MQCCTIIDKKAKRLCFWLWLIAIQLRRIYRLTDRYQHVTQRETMVSHRHTDDDWCEPTSLKNGCVVVNFCGTFICVPIIDFPCGKELEITEWSYLNWPTYGRMAMLHIVVFTPFGNTFPMAPTFISWTCLASRSSSCMFIFDCQVTFYIRHFILRQWWPDSFVLRVSDFLPLFSSSWFLQFCR